MKKKKNEILEEMIPTFSLAGGSMASSVLGGSLQSVMPPSVANPLVVTGKTTATFIPFTATLGVFSYTSKKFKSLNKKIEGGKK